MFFDWPAMVGEAIARRKAMRLSQRALATLAGVSTPTVNAFESGAQNLRLDGVIAILRALGLYEGPPDPKSLAGFLSSARAAADQVAPITPHGAFELALFIPRDSGRVPSQAKLRNLVSGLPLLRDIPTELLVAKGQVLETNGRAPGTAQFVRIDPAGAAFLRGAYAEDAPPSLNPGAVMDVSLPVIATAEWLRFSVALAAIAPVGVDPEIGIAGRFTGIAGRTLLAWADPLMTVDGLGGVAQVDSVDLQLDVGASRVEDDIASVIAEFLSPLYSCFSDFELTPALIASQLGLQSRGGVISTGPFAISKDMVAALDDETLPELLGKLLEAEATARGIPSDAIELGGNQTAADAGIDAQMAWQGAPSPAGRLPRRKIIFQCKATTMPKGDIAREMSPRGAPRPIFAELARDGGAYIMVSTDDPGTKGLEVRRGAMREAVKTVPDARDLHLDFLGADAIARWANNHVGVSLWLLARIGRPLLGWRPYGAWSSDESAGQAYLLDDRARAKIGSNEQTVRSAVAQLRSALRLPASAVRLVGMSGMGKTRLAEALFDRRVPGGAALDPALAIYADAGLELGVGIAAMAEQLTLSRIPAVLVVDNCSAASHRQLARILRQPDSRTSLLTIDYDVGDEQPEDTLVVRLALNSDGLLENILKQRFPALTDHARQRLATFSGGNARIAIGIARNCGPELDLARLNDVELLDRLFQRDRAEPDAQVRRAAEIASLVWAFYLDEGRCHAAEHAVLADQAGIGADLFYEEVQKLLEWGVVQQRGPQRAVMPPPLANLLAASYLARADRRALTARLARGPMRLFVSFARRLGQLHAHPAASSLAADLMKAGGLLGDLAVLADDRQRAFTAAAPAAPSAALAAIARLVSTVDAEVDDDLAISSATTLAHIAWQQDLFVDAMMTMLPLVLDTAKQRSGERVRDLFLERFRPGLSMTMADSATRLFVIDRLLADGRAEVRDLALDALDAMLGTQFSSSFNTDWGSRSQAREWRPRLPKDEQGWFGEAYGRLIRIASGGGAEAFKARKIAASHLRAHCDLGLAGTALTAMRAIRPAGYWDRGWRETCEALHFGANSPAPAWRAPLKALELSLRPRTLEDTFAAFVLSEPWRHWHPSGKEARHTRQTSLLARAVGVRLARSQAPIEPYLAQAFVCEGANSSVAFGNGLASAARDLDHLWRDARAEFELADPERSDAGVLIGILEGGDRRDHAWGNERLDEVARDPLLSPFLVHFHGGRALGAQDMARLSGALEAGFIKPAQVGALMYGGRTAPVPPEALAGLLERLALYADGLGPALEILQMRLYSDRQAKQNLAPALAAVARAMLTDPRLYELDSRRVGHEAGSLASHLLAQEDGAALATAICKAMRRAARTRDYWSEHDWSELSRAVMSAFPHSVLDELAHPAASTRSGSLLALFFGGSITNDIDGSRRRLAFDGQAVLAWVAEAPEERATIVAQVAPYTVNDDETSELEWNDFALGLVELAPDPVALLDTFERRFYSGVGTGPFWLRFERRQPMIARLLDHPDVRVRTWAAAARERLAREVEDWQARDQEEESLFE